MNSSPQFKPLIDLFGDESASEDLVAYALVALDDTVIERVEELFRLIKQEYGGHPSHRLHCRILFSGQQRKVSPWKHLSRNDVFAMYSKCATVIGTASALRQVAMADKSRYPSHRPADPVVPALKLGAKQVAALCFVSAVAPLENHFHQIRNFFVDADKTKIEWGIGRRQVQSIQLESFAQYRDRLKPTPVVNSRNASMIDAADMLAYVTCKAHSKHANADREDFRLLYSELNPSLMRFSLWHDGKFIG